MAREDDDREVQDTTLNRGSDTHAWSAVDRPGTDPSDPRPQGPDTGGFRDVPDGTGPQIVAPSQPEGQPAQMREIGPADPPTRAAPVVHFARYAQLELNLAARGQASQFLLVSKI